MSADMSKETAPSDEAAPWAKDAWFVLTTWGDGQGTTLHHGWAAICDATRNIHYTGPASPDEQEFWDRFLDFDAWDHCGGYPWRWASDYEDGGVSVTRITDPEATAAEQAELLAALREIADNRPFDDPIEHANFAMERARKALESVAKKPCGECHLQPGEICDICGARAALAKAEEQK